MIEKYRKQIRGKYIGFDVHADNYFSFETFTRLRTQWKIVAGPNGLQYIGLDYQAVASFLNLKNYTTEQRSSLIDDIQIMEKSALDVYNKSKP